MRRLIAFDAKSMKNILQIMGNHAFTEQRVDSVRRCVVPRQRELVVSKAQINNRFANHTQLHQAGIGIAV